MPCPFCGHTPFTNEIYYQRHGDFHVWCDHCGAKGPNREDIEECIQAYNKRASVSGFLALRLNSSRPTEYAAGWDDHVAAVELWLADAPHKVGCGKTYGLRNCTCGRDELLGIETPPGPNGFSAIPRQHQGDRAPFQPQPGGCDQ